MAVNTLKTTQMTWGFLNSRLNREPIDAASLNDSYTDLLWELNQTSNTYEIGKYNTGGSSNYYVGLITSVPYVNRGHGKNEDQNLKGPWYVTYCGTDPNDTSNNKYAFKGHIDDNIIALNTYYADRIVLKGEMDYAIEENAFNPLLIGTYYTGVGMWYDSYMKSKEYAAGKEMPKDTYFSTTSYAEIFNDYSNNVAKGKYSHAEGYFTYAEGFADHAEGINTVTTGSYSHVEGYYNNNNGSSCTHIEGSYNISKCNYTSHIEGSYNIIESYSKSCHVEGSYNIVSGYYNHVEGVYNTTYDTSAYSNISGEYNVSYSLCTRITGAFNVANINANYSSIEGFYNVAYGDGSHAEGAYNVAYGEGSHTEGINNVAYGDGSHAEGAYNVAYGEGSHAEGYINIVYGLASHAEGFYNVAYGHGSHAEGFYNVAHGDGSHAEGFYNVAYRDGSHAEGFYNVAYRESSHAEGYINVAYGTASHAEGAYNVAYGEGSHAEGAYNVAYGEGSHAEGFHNVAYGESSHAEGIRTMSVARYSHTSGEKTVAYNEIENAVGRYNISDNTDSNNYTIFSVGTGVDDNHRHNALAIYYNGTFNIDSNDNITIKSSGYILNTVQTDYVGYIGRDYELLISRNIRLAGDNENIITGTYIQSTYSYIGNSNNEITGTYSIGLGNGIKISSSDSVAIAKYNEDVDAYFVVGIGTSNENRKNAFWISQSNIEDINGTAYFSNNVYVYTNSYDSEQYPDKKDNKSWSQVITYNIYKNSYTYLCNIINDKVTELDNKIINSGSDLINEVTELQSKVADNTTNITNNTNSITELSSTNFIQSINGFSYTPTSYTLNFNSQKFNNTTNTWSTTTYNYEISQAQPGALENDNTGMAGLMSARDKARLDSIWEGDKPISTISISSGTWTIYKNDGTTTYNANDIKYISSSATNLQVEYGFKPQWTGTWKWDNSSNAKKNAERCTGTWGTTLPTNNTNSSSWKSNVLTSTGTVCSEVIYAAKRGLTILNYSNASSHLGAIVPASGEDSTSCSVSWSTYRLLFYGKTTLDIADGKDISTISGLSNAKITGRSWTINYVADGSTCFVMAYPADWDAINTIKKNGVEIITSSFLQVGQVDYTNGAGLTQKYYVYRSGVGTASMSITIN